MNENPEIMRKENYMSWKIYFMSIAILSKFRSKDKNTQNGACIVGFNNKILGIGYNGLPNGLNDKNDEFWYDDDTNIEKSRHSYIIHAEQNAIFNSNIQNLNNSSIYVPQLPCDSCARSIIQVGIKKVYYIFKKEKTLDHQRRNKVVEKMFKYAKVELIDFNSLNLKDKSFISKLDDLGKEDY